MNPLMTYEEAMLTIRRDLHHKDVVCDCYIEEDLLRSAKRFQDSAEFAEVEHLLQGRLRGAKVLDLGAGNGIASYAFARVGARLVYALEPNPSNEFGVGAIRRLSDGLPIEVLRAIGERIPLADSEVEIVYVRQVLHHASDLKLLLKECARVLKTGGVLLACREHVVDNQEQLGLFLERHPVHKLVGGENAYPLDAYLDAIRSAGLAVEKVLGPWDSIINAFPEVRTQEEFDSMPTKLLKKRFGALGVLIALFPGAQRRIWRHLRSRRSPGRMYSFMATRRRS